MDRTALVGEVDRVAIWSNNQSASSGGSGRPPGCRSSSSARLIPSINSVTKYIESSNCPHLYTVTMCGWPSSDAAICASVTKRWRIDVVGRVAIGQNLERHLAAEPEIGCRIHDRGATTVDRLVESVLVETCPGSSAINVHLRARQQGPESSTADRVYGKSRQWRTGVNAASGGGREVGGCRPSRRVPRILVPNPTFLSALRPRIDGHSQQDVVAPRTRQICRLRRPRIAAASLPPTSPAS